MMLKIYNTKSRSVEVFKPLKEGKVGLYTCGPTVYHYAHIGNLRTYVFEDVLKRVLKRRAYEVNHVMNITDVGHLTDDGDSGEDKMEVGAKREGQSAYDIAELYTKAFKKDLGLLNIEEPNIWCKATDHIAEQIDMVKKLEAKGYTYVLEDGVYFESTKFKEYGKMAGLDLDGLQAGSRIEHNLGKKNISDFSVWKFSPKDTQRQMEWDSPWGRGFPGWHLECSAMSLKYLGEELDIHCGGADHVRVHHTNEIAQTEGVTGKAWVSYWMHGEFLLIDEGKMSKSADHFLTLESLMKKGIDPMAYRLFLMSAHYRKTLNFSEEALNGAQKALNRLRLRAADLDEQGGEISQIHIKRFDDALDEDLNVTKALSHMWMMLQDEELNSADKGATLKEMNKVLQLDPFKKIEKTKEDFSSEILGFLEKRNAARKNKDYALADEFRGKIEALGYKVVDKGSESELEKI